MELDCLDIESSKDADSVDQLTLHHRFCSVYSVSSQHAIGTAARAPCILHMDADMTFSQIAVALSDRTVSVFDGSALKHLLSFSDHEKRITSVRFVPGHSDLILSSSLDGTIRQYDVRSGNCVLQFFDQTSGKRKPLTCADINCAGQFICAGSELFDENAFVVFWDVRQSQPMGGYWQSHSDEITQVRFHPSDAGVLCSSSTDGLLNVFDVRQSREDDALQATLNTEVTARSLTWFGDGSSDLVASVLDVEGVQVWNVQDQERTLSLLRDDVCRSILRTVSDVCYVAGCHRLDDGGLLTLAGSNSEDCCGVFRALKLDEGGKMKPFAVFSDEQTPRQLVRTSVLHPQSCRLVTGGESGVLSAWSLDAQS